MNILGVETSCDETSVAVVADGREVRSNVISSQTIHGKFGGVVPEVASRAHLKTIVPVFRQALKDADVELEQIDLVAATMGPGLVGPLLVGLTFAKALSFARNIPFIAINHLEGHLSANMLEYPDLEPHHLSLIVSGGHTMLVEVKNFGDYQVLGETVDDAAGEAFDKVAKLLGLGYPGGAELDRLAENGDPKAVSFPRPMIRDESYRFSFSGLKTAVALHVKSLTDLQLDESRADIAASFQEAVVESLITKTIRAALDKGITDIALSGGVAANSRLRTLLEEKLQAKGCRLFYPSRELCTDNAAMIAAAGFYKFNRSGRDELTVNAVPWLTLS